MEKTYFKNDAKQIVDMLFDNKLFKEDMTRDSLNLIEDFIDSSMQGRCDSHLKCEKLMDKINNK